MKRTLKALLFILLIYFIFPILVNAATSLDTLNQRPVVGTSIELTLRVDYGKDVYVSEAHYYITYDASSLEFEDLSWTQSHGSYSNSNGVITIDKYATSEAWGYGAPVVLKFKSKTNDSSPDCSLTNSTNFSYPFPLFIFSKWYLATGDSRDIFSPYSSSIFG